MNKEKIAALILAAGYSSRLGEFKPLLRLGGKPLWERATELFRVTGLGEIRVVVGHQAEELIPSLESAKVSWVVNPNFQQGMFSSVLVGIESLGKDCEAFFVLPVDIPLVRPQTTRDLLEAYRQGRWSIVYPVFSGKRGHPPLISTEYRQAIRGYSGVGGLRGFLDAHGEKAVEVEVADEGILLDVDSHSDYEKLEAKCARRGIPTVAECLVLLRKHTKPGRGLIEHSVKVAQVALCLGRALQETGSGIDLEVVSAAALLHDVVRDKPQHAEAGVELLFSLGYPEVAEVVKAHMDIAVSEQSAISAQEVLYLADKLVEGSRVMPLEKRLQVKLGHYGKDSEAKEGLMRRMNNAVRIREKIEAVTGRPLQEMLAETEGVVGTNGVNGLPSAAR